MDKGLIKNFAKDHKTEGYEKAYSSFLDRLFSAIDDVSEKLKYLTPDKTKIIPIGECVNRTFIDEYGGEMDVVIAINDQQIALANQNYEKKSKELTNAIRRTKKQKEDLGIYLKNTSQEIIQELFTELINYFDERTTLLITEDGIKILSGEEIGYKFLIRIATYNSEDEDLIFSIWNPLLKKTNNINIFTYVENFENKNLFTKGNFNKIVRIFKNFRKSLLLSKSLVSPNYINKYLIELICFNIPNQLLVGNDIDKVFIKAFNYLENVPNSALKSFDEKSPASEFFLAQYGIMKFKTLLSKIKLNILK